MHTSGLHPPRLLALALVAMLAAAACGSSQSPAPADPATQDPATSAPAETPAPTPPPAGGGTLTFAVEGAIDTLDPAIAYNTSALPAQRLIFETLVDYDAGTTIVPGLAEALPEISADGTVYTFTLREGVQFVKGDGTVLRAVTAQDVIDSLNRLLSPNLTPTPSPVAGAFFTVIKGGQAVVDGTATEAAGLRAVDDRTVEITLERASGSFLNVLAMSFAAVVPVELAGTDTDAFSADPVGTGPFRLAEVKAGESYRFVRNEAYWAPERQLVDEILYRVNVDANTQLQEVQAGTLDIMGNDIPAGSWDAVRNDPRWKDQIAATPLVATNFLWMNTGMTDTPLANVKVRQAISHAIDRANLQKIIGEGRSTAATQIFPPLMPGHDPSFDPYPYDPAKAKTLLAEAGYAEGFSSTIYTDSQDTSKAIVESMQRDLAAIGVAVEIVQQPFDVLLGTISTPRTAPMTYIGWFQDYPDPSDFIDPMFSCATAVEGGANNSFYCNEEVDALAAAANVEPDSAKRLEMYRQVQAAILADAPAAPTDHPTTVPLVAKRVTGFAIHPVWLYALERYGLSE